MTPPRIHLLANPKSALFALKKSEKIGSELTDEAAANLLLEYLNLQTTRGSNALADRYERPISLVDLLKHYRTNRQVLYRVRDRWLLTGSTRTNTRVAASNASVSGSSVV